MNFDLDFAVSNFFQAIMGIPTTLIIVAVAVIIGLPLAFVIAVARINKTPVVSTLLTLYISFMRGTPMVVQIFLVYNGMPVLLKAAADLIGAQFDVYSVNPLLYAFVVFSLNSAATYSEMWKAGLSAISKGQFEASYMAGLSTFQTYTHVVIPQAFGVAAPSFCSSTLNMLKNTSLVFIMTVLDITARAKIAAGLEYKYVEGYADILLTYIIVCSVLEWLFKKMEKRVTRYKTDADTQKKKQKFKSETSVAI